MVADEMSEPLQGKGGDTVARRHRLVGKGLGPVHQRLVVVRGEEEAAALRVLEMLEQQVGQLDGERQVIGIPA